LISPSFSREILTKINTQVSFVENSMTMTDDVQQKKDSRIATNNKVRNQHHVGETKIYDSSDIDPCSQRTDFVKHLEVYAKQALKTYQESLEEYEVWKQSPIDKETKTIQFPNPRLKFYTKMHG